MQTDVNILKKRKQKKNEEKIYRKIKNRFKINKLF